MRARFPRREPSQRSHFFRSSFVQGGDRTDHRCQSFGALHFFLNLGVDMPRFINEVLNQSNTSSDVIEWAGGPGTFVAVGTWGGATNVKVQMRIQGSSFIDVSNDLTFTTGKVAGFQLCRAS